MSLKVLIAEENEIRRIGLHSIFREDERVVKIYEVNCEEDLLRSLRQKELNLIVVNYAIMTDFSYLREQNFVVLAKKPELAHLTEVYSYGSLGYLSLDASADLLRIFLRLPKDTFLIDPSLVPLLMKQFLVYDDNFGEDADFTLRERQIMHMIYSGMDKQSIAQKLSIADTTLKTHIKNISKKKRRKNLIV